jgi:hypothetical protein
MIALLVIEISPIIIGRGMSYVSCLSQEVLPETPNRALKQPTRLNQDQLWAQTRWLVEMGEPFEWTHADVAPFAGLALEEW